MVDGATRCIKPEWDKQSLIDAELHKILRMTKGAPFKRIEKLIRKNPTCSNSSPKRKTFNDVNEQNPAGKTANSSSKADILILETTAEGNCT